jgi:hypothetical protein
MSLPKYTKEKKKGNIGEALVQYLLSDFSLVHKIDGSNDVGNDFICELINDESPTNLLFYVQVKYTNRKPSIKKETLEYWRTSPIPVYLFWLKDRVGGSLVNPEEFSRAEIKYKRYTPIVHKSRHRNEDFKVFNRQTFLRDLIIDYARTQYRKGFAPVLKPRDYLTLDEKNQIGFPQYKLLVHQVIPEYKEEILKGGWSNLLALGIALEDSEIAEERAMALNFFRLAQALISKDEELFQQGIFWDFINEHIQRLI